MSCVLETVAVVTLSVVVVGQHQILRRDPDFQNQNLYFNRVPSWTLCNLNLRSAAFQFSLCSLVWLSRLCSKPPLFLFPGGQREERREEGEQDSEQPVKWSPLLVVCAHIPAKWDILISPKKSPDLCWQGKGPGLVGRGQWVVGGARQQTLVRTIPAPECPGSFLLLSPQLSCPCPYGLHCSVEDNKG